MASIPVINNPLITSLEEDLLGSVGSFPERVYLLFAGEGKYACNNATTPDGMIVNGLACFPDPDEATTYMALAAGLNGEIVSKTFEEAREIAKSKEVLDCLFLFAAGAIVEIHFVR